MTKLKKDFPRPNHKAHTDSYKTDAWILKIFEDWFDPCPYNPNYMMTKYDGLKVPWPDRTYVNPPYSYPGPWIEKAIKENKERGSTIVMLLRNDCSTKWYFSLHQAGAKFLMINGRLEHQTGKPANFSSMLVVLQ